MLNISFRDNKGTAAVITGLMMVSILGFCALVVDIGSVGLERNRLQNAVDSAALAAAQDLPNISAAEDTAEAYIVSNGFIEAAINVSFSHSDRRVTVDAAQPVDYSFAGVFGIGSTDVIASATAQKGGTYLGGAFDYAVFSGSTNHEIHLNPNGNDTYIQGSVHSNNGFRYNGNNYSLEITGALDTVGSITLNGPHTTIGEQIPNSSYIDMPDFSEEIKQLAQTVGTYYNASQSFNGNMHIDGGIYVNGHINFNSTNLSGVGTILAKDNINFNQPVTFENPGSDSVCIYSQNGNIHFNNAGAVIRGTIFAPNGSVILNNSIHTIYGRIIAQKIIFNGGIDVYSSSEDTIFMESFDEGIRLIR